MWPTETFNINSFKSLNTPIEGTGCRILLKIGERWPLLTSAMYTEFPADQPMN